MVGRRRPLALLGLGGLLVLALATPVTAEDGVLVFELDNEDAVVDEHTAQTLWNLTTDNTVMDNVTGWNSLYLEKPGVVSGRIVADLEAGSIGGEITEGWLCNNDCIARDGSPSWTTTNFTSWTAVISGGTLTPDGSGWKIDGSVKIAYEAVVTSIESPSDCGGQECYTCAERLCKMSEEMTATTSLEGWIDGDTLSLAFADRLEADTSQMDFSDMRQTQFFMSRFSITMTGSIAAISEDPPQQGAVEAPEVGQADAPPTAEAADNSAAAADDPAADQQNAIPEQNSTPEQNATPESPLSGGDAGDSDKMAFEVILILFLLVLGSAAWIVLKKPKWFMPRKRRSAPKPPSPLPVAEGTVEAGVGAITEATAPEPQVTYTLVGNEKLDYRATEIQTGPTTVTRYAAGTKVKVLRRAFDAVEIKIGSDKPVWVDRSYIQMKRID
jgi:hypothetical protein